MSDQGRHCVYTTSGRRPFRYGGRASYDPITHTVSEEVVAGWDGQDTEPTEPNEPD